MTDSTALPDALRQLHRPGGMLPVLLTADEVRFLLQALAITIAALRQVPAHVGSEAMIQQAASLVTRLDVLFNHVPSVYTPEDLPAAFDRLALLFHAHYERGMPK
jgi:glycerol-3-phosphate O-acyltransferase